MSVLKNRRAVTQFNEENGCHLAKEKAIFYVIYAMSNGHPCDGCGYLGTCSQVRVFRQEDRNQDNIDNSSKKLKPKTNAEVAAELGISKRQTSKLNRQRNQ
jgi:hypothetical protein